MLVVYAGGYLTLQYTPLQHATNLVALEREHQAMGRRYARNAAGDMNHLVCVGFTDLCVWVSICGWKGRKDRWMDA